MLVVVVCDHIPRGVRRDKKTQRPFDNTMFVARVRFVLHRFRRQVEKEVQKELDADKPEGEEALNHLFKQIYGNVGSSCYM